MSKNQLIRGLEAYSLSLACSTVIYAYYACFYDTIKTVSLLLHLLLFFLLPFFGLVLYMLTSRFKDILSNMGDLYVEESWTYAGRAKKRKLVPLSTVPRLRFSNLSREELESIQKEVAKALDKIS